MAAFAAHLPDLFLGYSWALVTLSEHLSNDGFAFCLLGRKDSISIGESSCSHVLRLF
jgi:hypothetical protein